MKKYTGKYPGNTRATLTVVAISYNEERDLPGFLNNLMTWVDEIVIVDDGSQDKTKHIAGKHGDKVKFIVSPRTEGEYFSHQRNKGIAATCCDWILHMDIDERVSPALSLEILEAINDTDKDAYRFRRLNHFMHRPMRGGGWQDWNLVHLARRTKFHFEGMFHEKCVVESPDERIGQLDSRMYHLNEDSFRKRLRKSETYLDEVVVNIRKMNQPITGFQILLRTLAEFLKKYIVKKGFKDGTPGLIFALHSSTAIFRAYALVWDEQNSISREALESSIESEWRAPSSSGKS
jgi:(heptosyl)LPS beta-1,4-glucosyltransferase